MTKAHYIIFHPDNQRNNIKISATAIVNGVVNKQWIGNVYVDKLNDGNEDPFVFVNPWLYSFCHASQLRRKTRSDNYLQKGSWLLFSSGNEANEGRLTFDTIFLIAAIQTWFDKPLDLPLKYRDIPRNNTSELWKFPFHGIHSGVTHTYEAELWATSKNKFSFLPLDNNDSRVTIPFNALNSTTLKKIVKNVKGKYPVLLTTGEIFEILNVIEQRVKTKVVKDISTNVAVTILKEGKRC